ncbi:rhamnan synthesis F family protein [Sphingomonas sanguinis]|jgi:lipopolysaccharide biosynthesis protein|uniref:rhamnan synthesis F family protein n=1 Tax=Sphingomonas sp. LC-1 TaxID=3110957 RepID=UPI0021BAF2A5|nr:rhamnan synthesis F family protein [Sphingomonas sp. LC-1]MCT8003877.1 rhamnan synthesis F family protein [Sphingomonas sp. LC-1]
MPIANKLPAVVRRPLRYLWREALVPIRGRIRPAQDDVAAQIPFAYVRSDHPTSSKPRIAIICHLFHEDLAGQFRKAFDNLPAGTDLYLSTDSDAKVPVIRDAFRNWGGHVDIRVLPNRGRDIGPKLVGFADVYSRYDLLLFIHSKKSLTSDLGNIWRDMLIRTLAGSPLNIASILEIFDRHPEIGLVAPQHFPNIRGLLHWDGNFRAAQALARRMGLSIKRRMMLDFPSGSMFWARPDALRPLLDLHLEFEDFPPEANQVRDTPQHAVERLFFLVAEHAGYGWLKVTEAGIEGETPSCPIGSPATLDAFVSRSRIHLLGRARP